MSIFVHRKSKTGPLTLSTHHLSEGLDNHRTLTCLRHLSFWRLVESFQAIKFSLLGMTKSKKGRLLPQWPQKVRVSQRKLLRATVKLFGNGAHLGLGTRAGLLPQQERGKLAGDHHCLKGWIFLPGFEHRQLLWLCWCLQWRGGRKVAKHLIIQYRNTIPQNTTLSLCWVQPPSIHWELEILGTLAGKGLWMTGRWS